MHEWSWRRANESYPSRKNYTRSNSTCCFYFFLAPASLSPEEYLISSQTLSVTNNVNCTWYCSRSTSTMCYQPSKYSVCHIFAIDQMFSNHHWKLFILFRNIAFRFCWGCGGGYTPSATIPLIRAIQAPSKAPRLHTFCLATKSEGMERALSIVIRM